MTSKIRLIIIIALLIVSFGNIFFLIRKMNNSRKLIEKENKELVAEIQMYRNFQKRNNVLLSQQVNTNFISIIPVQYLDNRPLLIYTYAGGDCNSCITDDIESVKSRLNQNNKNRFLALPIGKNDRNANIAFKADLDGVTYVRCDSGSIIFPIDEDKNKARYFALIMPNKSVIAQFFPNKNLVYPREAYLDFIFEKYLNARDSSSVSTVKYD